MGGGLLDYELFGPQLQCSQSVSNCTHFINLESLSCVPEHFDGSRQAQEKGCFYTGDSHLDCLLIDRA